MKDVVTPEQVNQFKGLIEKILRDGVTKREARRVIEHVETEDKLLSFIREKGKNPHSKVFPIFDYFEYPEDYSGAHDLEEQATILRKQYQFPLKPLAKVKKLPKGAEGLWIIPLVEDIIPLGCEHPYNYAVNFVLERLATKYEKFTNWRQDTMSYRYLRQNRRTLRLWDQLVCLQGKGNLTPVVPCQFGIMHVGESVDYAREDAFDGEILLGTYHIGCMLLTTPERQKPLKLEIFCAGDEYSLYGDGEFASAPFLDWTKEKLIFGTKLTELAYKYRGSPSGFIVP